MTTFTTPRLTVRPLVEDDTEAMVDLFADPELSRFHNRMLSDPDEARGWARRRLDHRSPAGTGHWVFELAGTVIGVGRLEPTVELPGDVLDCGFYVSRAYWGTGLAAEAVSAILRHAYGSLAAPAVFALVHEDNAQCRAFVKKLGFLDVGAGEHYGAPHRVVVALPESAGLHHVEIWVPTLAQARRSWGWLLTELGWAEYQSWEFGLSWRRGATYLVFEDSPARSARRHERLRPGLNHIALHVDTPERVEELVKACTEHGWQLMFGDRHPYAGGPHHYAAYLENDDGYEVELVAPLPVSSGRDD